MRPVAQDGHAVEETRPGDAMVVDAADDASLVDPAEGQLIPLASNEADDSATVDEAQQTKRRVQLEGMFHYLILAICIAVVVLSFLLSVHDRRQVVVPILGQPLPELCHLKRYTGIDCPGCGMTRSFISIAHARWLDAWRYNPAAFLLFPIVLFQIPYRLIQIWRLRTGRAEWQLGRWGQGVIGVFVAVALSQWVLRQLGVWL